MGVPENIFMNEFLYVRNDIMKANLDKFQKENEELRQEIKDWEDWAKNYF